MKLILFLLIILLFGSSDRCSENSKIDFLGCWTDSREENKVDSDSNIYRPCDFKEFLPSRFRFSFELLEDDSCLWFRLDPADAHSMEKGTWTFDSKTNILIIENLQKEKIAAYLVIKFEKNLLQLKAI